MKERDAQLADMAKEHTARIEKLRADLEKRLADVSRDSDGAVPQLWRTTVICRPRCCSGMAPARAAGRGAGAGAMPLQLQVHPRLTVLLGHKAPVLSLASGGPGKLLSGAATSTCRRRTAPPFTLHHVMIVLPLQFGEKVDAASSAAEEQREVAGALEKENRALRSEADAAQAETAAKAKEADELRKKLKTAVRE